MRTILYSALTAIALGAGALAPAGAATHWSCMGPAVACSPAPSAPARSTYNYRSSKRVYGAKHRSLKRTHAARSGKRHAARGKHHGKRHAAVHKRSKSARLAKYRTSRPEAGAAAKRTTSAASGGRKGKGQSGVASYYWRGQRTASGGRFNPNGLTAAHRTLPFGTKVRVTNKRNGRSVVVTINDRGPFIRGRVIDLSSGAAGVIGMKGSGLAPVSLEVVGG